MDDRLVVVRAFGAYAQGAVIADPAVIQTVLAGEHALHVVRVAPWPAAAPVKEG